MDTSRYFNELKLILKDCTMIYFFNILFYAAQRKNINSKLWYLLNYRRVREALHTSAEEP